MDADRKYRGFITLAVSGQNLPRSRNSLEHGIHDFEMARIRNQHDLDLVTARDLPLSSRAEMILHVAGLADRIRRRVLSLELLEDRRVRLAERVRQNVDASAMRHRQVDFTGAVGRGRFDRDIQHRNQDVAALDREALVALIGASEEPFEPVDVRESLKYRFLFFPTQ